jgi:hypothetical protein
MFEAIQTQLEIVLGYFNKISLELKRPIHIDGYNVTAVDELISG